MEPDGQLASSHRRTSEADLLDSLVGAQLLADGIEVLVGCNHLEYTLGDTRATCKLEMSVAVLQLRRIYLNQCEYTEWSLGRDLEDHGSSNSKCRSKLADWHTDSKVPRAESSYDTDWLVVSRCKNSRMLT